MLYPYANWAILAVFAFVYSLVAGRTERTWISGPIIFTAFGLLTGPFGLGVLKLNVNSENLRIVVELTLALVLFTDAASTNLAALKNSLRTPFRLLLVGLPLTILLGTVVGQLLFHDLDLIEVALLGTMLAPTDAALGKAVVTNPNVPAPLREDLNVESGLNDGICVPILLALLAIATHAEASGGTAQLVLGLFAEAIGIGVVVGVIFALLGARLVKSCSRLGWLAGTWQPVSMAALAVACFAFAQALGGSGFIAAFVGGLVFGSTAKPFEKELLEASEAVGNTLSLLTWVTFGSAVVGLVVTRLTWPMVLYAMLSLTLVRMLPVFLCLMGLALDRDSKLFVGWFGPRGLASIVFAVIVLDADLPHGDTLVVTVAFTVILSVLAHGLTANPIAKRYGQSRQPLA